MKHSLRKRYLTSFLAIALLPLLTVCVAVYAVYPDYVQSQIRDTRASAFNSASLKADYLLDGLLRFAEQIDNNLSLYLQEEDNATRDSAITTALSGYEQHSDVPVTMLFFNRHDPNRIHSSQGLLDYRAFELGIPGNVDVNRSSIFYNLLSASHTLLYRLTYRPDSTEPGFIACVVPLGDASTTYRATLLFLIPELSFLDAFEGELGPYAGNLCGLDTYGNTVFARMSDVQAVIGNTPLFNLSGTGYIEKEGLSFLRQTSQTNLLTYTLTMRPSMFYSAWIVRERHLLITVSLLLAFCIAMAIWAANTNYKPIRAAYRIMQGSAPGRHQNELQQMAESYRSVVANMGELTQHINHNAHLIMSHFVLKLINGKVNDQEEFAYHETCLAIDFHRPLYAALFLHCTYIADVLTRDALLRLCDGIHCPSAELLYAECTWEKGIALLLNFASDAAEQFLQETAERIVRLASAEGLGGMISVGIGSVEESYTQLNRSFYKAVVARRGTEGEAKVIAVYQESPLDQRFYNGDHSLLAEGLSYGNLEVALNALEEMLVNLRTGTAPFPLVSLMCSSILLTVIRAANKQGIELNVAELSSTAQINDLDAFARNTRDIITQVCQVTSKKHAEVSSTMASNVIGFIAQHYMRSDFSLNLLATETGVSMSKINAVLKNNLGCGFGQFVTMLRLKEAKRLLRDTDTSIQDIVQRVGYIDASSFTRKFKQTEGCSPGQYRQTHRA